MLVASVFVTDEISVKNTATAGSIKKIRQNEYSPDLSRMRVGMIQTIKSKRRTAG